LIGELMLFLVAGVRREDLIGLNADFEDLAGVFLTTVRFLGVVLILLCLTRAEDGRRDLTGLNLRLGVDFLVGVTRFLVLVLTMRVLGFGRETVFLVFLVKTLGLLTLFDFLA
jgi:hypothetical protein